MIDVMSDVSLKVRISVFATETKPSVAYVSERGLATSVQDGSMLFPLPKVLSFMRYKNDAEYMSASLVLMRLTYHMAVYSKISESHTCLNITKELKMEMVYLGRTNLSLPVLTSTFCTCGE